MDKFLERYNLPRLNQEEIENMNRHMDTKGRLEMNYREKNIKNTNTCRLNNTLLNNQEIAEEIKGNQKIPRDK